MPQVTVFCPMFDAFTPPPTTGTTWTQLFPVFIHGTGVATPMSDVIEVVFDNDDPAATMDNKMKAAAIAKAAARGVQVVDRVVTFSPPRKL